MEVVSVKLVRVAFPYRFVRSAALPVGTFPLHDTGRHYHYDVILASRQQDMRQSLPITSVALKLHGAIQDIGVLYEFLQILVQKLV